jgi:hypothetical protein
MQLFGKKAEPSVWSSRAKLALGAAGLLLFIVGVKRTYRLHDAAGTVLDDDATGGGAGSGADATSSPSEEAKGR